MSFNSRFPPEHNRRRHNGNGPRFTQTAAAKAEDTQPNELLSKRNVAGPPVIRTSVPIPRNCGRGTYTGRGAPASFRGRGGLHTAAPTPRTDRSTGGFYSQAGHAIPGSSARPNTQVGGRNVQANASTHVTPTPWPPNAPSQQHGFSNYSHATHRAERSNDENPSATQNGAFPIAFGSVSAALNQKHALDAASVSTLSPNFLKGRGHHHPAIPPRPQPPIPRRQTLFANLREPPPHLSGLGNASISGSDTHNSEQASPAASRPAMDNISSAGSSRASSSDGTPLSLRPHLKPANATKSLASASDLLLSDLNKPATSTETSRGHLPPPAKRRKLSPPAIPRTRLPSPSLPPPRVKLSEALAPPDAPSVPPPSETPVPATLSENVKRERSPSPTIGGDSAPQLTTEGCVRIAPLPPECKNTRPGHKEARKIWTTREVTRLRGLGVQPTRIFVREDGMVIDWKSKVPVMSDTLRPPPTSANPVKAAPLSGKPSSPPTKKQKLQATSTGEMASREHEGDGRARKHGPASPSRWPVQSTSWGELPAPGETIWRRVLPPPRPSVAGVGEDVRRDAVPYARSGCPSPAVGPSTGGQAAEDIVDLTEGDDAEVEIIDLTDEPDIQPEGSAPPHSAAQTKLPASVNADGDEMEAAALRFLQRYIADFATDRAALASAYSRAATFSTQTLPSSPRPIPGADAPSRPLARHHGRFEIISALLDLPGDEAPTAARKVEYDFVYAREAGDVLLACYTATRVPEQTVTRGKGKQKEKAIAKLPDGLCEQRFILRPREWDEEDSATPGVWPLVAVAHQMLFRPLPP